MVTTVAVMAAVCAAADATPKSVECHMYRDAAIRLAFPERLAGLTMTTRTTYAQGDDNYSLSYFPTEGGVKRYLSIYVYVRDGRPMPDGVNDAVSRQLDEADEIIKRHRLNVMSQGMTSEGRLKKCGVCYLWNSYLLKFDDDDAVCSSFALVFALRNRFVKLRYSEPAPDGMEAPCEVLPQSMLKILSELDELISASEIDVYVIADPTNRLAAIRAKWPRAADRVSQWEMPDYEDTYERIMRLNAWCKEKYGERIERYEENCREAISSKIDPALWYYNLSCALAMQKKDSVEVLDALEQAVAAGYNCADHAKSDSDFGQLTNDVRFLKLCESMIAINKPDKYWYDPPEPIVVESGKCYLSETNVCYAFDAHSYRCCLDSTNPCPIVYLNHHAHHDAVPCDGLIVPQFPKEAVKHRCNVGAANMHFIHLQKESYAPAIVASNWTQEEKRMDRPMSIPAAFGTTARANREMEHFIRNVIGIYTAASDYGFDGIDRFIGHFPICIAHAGGAGEADKFVRLCRDVIRAMSPELRKFAAVWTLDIIRHSQKQVNGENDYMSGVAWRPVLSFEDIDVERAISYAKNQDGDADSLPPAPPLIRATFDEKGEIPCIDVWGDQYDYPHIAESGVSSCFVARGTAMAHRYEVEARNFWKWKEPCEFVWKVLQGDGKKVRLVPLKDDRSRMRVEVDWHDVFDVELPDGRKVKSSRVDIGCFSVRKGRASLPAIISVYFSPNATREYGADGKLVSIDYTKRQLEGFCPKLCPRGDWKDVFHWNKVGEMTGWTRYCADMNGRVTTNEFTREGLMIDTRDALGRPKDVHRSMASTWKQELDLPDFTNEIGLAKLGYYGSQYDRLKERPEKTTLAWKYEYENDADRFGNPSPKAPTPFKYRPELCLRADFSEDSGFRLPLIDQMEFGYCTHVGYRHDTIGWCDRADELIREDSRAALETKGLKQPKVLKKMKFCPWKPGTNDVWKLDLSEREQKWHDSLMELADGVYRNRFQDDEKAWQEVSETYWTVNWFLEMDAYAALDKAYRPCKADEVRKVLGDRATSEDWDVIQIVEDGYVKFSEVQKDKNYTLAMWQISDDIYFGIHTEQRVQKGPRSYFFRKVDDLMAPLAMDIFREMPSRAIGNAVLSADVDDAEAINNFAVLFYAGIANPGKYEESSVLKLLKRAALKGSATAMYNVGVLFENRGEMQKAKIAYDTARAQEKESAEEKGGEEDRGKMGAGRE